MVTFDFFCKQYYKIWPPQTRRHESVMYLDFTLKSRYSEVQNGSFSSGPVLIQLFTKLCDDDTQIMQLCAYEFVVLLEQSLEMLTTEQSFWQ